MDMDKPLPRYHPKLKKSTLTLLRKKKEQEQGVKRPTMVKPLKVKAKRVCANPNCGEEFVPYRPQNIYCSDKCQETVYNATNNIPQRLRDIRERRRNEKSAEEQ
jgi:hypothetical protein